MNKKELLEKYYAGKTSLEEEQLLRNNKWLEEDLEFERLLFGHLQTMHKTEAPQKAKTTIVKLGLLAIPAIAASILLLIYFGMPKFQTKTSSTLQSQLLVDASFSGEITNKEMALAQTKKALTFMNQKINQGTRSLQHLKGVNQTINQIKQSKK